LQIVEGYVFYSSTLYTTRDNALVDEIEAGVDIGEVDDEHEVEADEVGNESSCDEDMVDDEVDTKEVAEEGEDVISDVDKVVI
jgi:hypothetical protein